MPAQRVATVLLVDQHPEAGFGLRATLGKQPHLRLLEAGNAGQALDVLVTQVVDVIVACVRAPDTEALPLLRQLQQQEHLAPLPFLLVADDDRVATKVKALQHGATDYIARPYAMAEVVARVEAAVRRQLSSTNPQRRDGCLGGDFRTIAFSDLVHLLQIGQRTGTLTLLTPSTTGQALFVDGQVYHATFGSMEGEEAFYRLVFETAGHFEFKPTTFDLRTVRNTVALTTTTLLMEAARRLDSWRRDHPEGDGALPDPTAARPQALPPGTVLPAAPGSAAAAAALQAQLDGERRPGLRLLCRDELPAFTESTAGRCLVLLVADAGAAIAAFCSAAEPPGPALVEQALAYEQKALALCVAAPGGERLDVLLLNQEFPGYVLNELRLQPEAVLVAPRGGDWFQLSMLAQNELGSILEHLRPRQLLGLGEAALAEGLRFLQQRAAAPASVHCLPTPLVQWANLRVALGEVLQRWAVPEVVDGVREQDAPAGAVPAGSPVAGAAVPREPAVV